MKTEAENAIGMQIMRARREVIIVPAIKGRAPYCSLPAVGFHTVDVMNLSPYSLNAGTDPPARERTIAAPRIKIVSDEMKRITFVILSPFLPYSPNGFPS